MPKIKSNMNVRNYSTLRRLIDKSLKHIDIAREAIQKIEEEELYHEFPEDLDIISTKLTEILGDGDKRNLDHLSLAEIQSQLASK